MTERNIGSLMRAALTGAVVGGGVGFVLGLLLAPSEGATMRRRLVYRLEHLADQVADLADEIVSPGADSEARRRGDAIVADARAQARRIRDDIDHLMGEIRRQGSATGDAAE